METEYRKLKGENMRLKTVTRYSEDIKALEKINEEAIPASERNTLDDMLSTGAELIGICVENEPIGFLVIRKYKKICYLAYLAVKQELRSNGIGSAALKVLIAEYSDYQVVVEFEAPTAHSENDDIKLRRKHFYLKNGFNETGWFTYYDETEFEIGSSVQEFDVGGFGEFTEYLSTVLSDHIHKSYQK